VAQYGIIPLDSSHSEDLVRRIQDILQLLWGKHAEEKLKEACQILGISTLQEFFQQPGNFYAHHIKRYSKSRRKAPIYWLLQSAHKNYGLWLYYPVMNDDTLFKALTLYADPKLNLEKINLEDLITRRNRSDAAHDRRELEKAISRQEALIAELTDFRNELERLALLRLSPDFNDGVLISIAPLHTLTPWKEAGKMWTELSQGKYPWSSMGQRMRERGLIEG
jgi:hypothetical protein